MFKMMLKNAYNSLKTSLGLNHDSYSLEKQNNQLQVRCSDSGNQTTYTFDYETNANPSSIPSPIPAINLNWHLVGKKLTDADVEGIQQSKNTDICPSYN